MVENERSEDVVKRIAAIEQRVTKLALEYLESITTADELQKLRRPTDLEQTEFKEKIIDVIEKILDLLKKIRGIIGP